MERYQQWMSFTFDNTDTKKTKVDSKLDIKFAVPADIKSISYKDALYHNASVMRDNFSEPFDVLLSGGIDSEVIARTFKDLGITHNTYIFKYEDDLNCRDVASAEEICKSLNINYKIIDFNLKHFYLSSEAVDIFEKTLIPSASALSRIKWLDYLDNIPVNGEGEPTWKRSLVGNYNEKSSWTYDLNEFFLFFSLCKETINRTVIGDWYLYTPEITRAHYQHPLITKLLSDQIKGKQSSISSRILLHREIWPEIKTKEKLTGYEGPTAAASWNNVPTYFKDFSDQNKKIKTVLNSKFSFSEEEFKNIFHIR